MNSRDSVTWVVVIALTVVGLGYWVYSSLPGDAEVAAAVRPLTPMPTELVNESTRQALENRSQHGDLPVQPVNPQPPRNNPFTAS